MAKLIKNFPVYTKGVNSRVLLSFSIHKSAPPPGKNKPFTLLKSSVKFFLSKSNNIGTT
jgi:hypothetical protein